MTWTLTIEALNASDEPETLRFSLGRYDAPDNAFYDPRMLQPGLYQAGLYAGHLLQQGRSGHGETTLENSDGALNYLADYAVDGRAMQLRFNGQLQVVGTVSRLAFRENEVGVILRDPLEPLRSPHPMDVYAGDNVLPDGLEGTENDIAGEPKPQAWGRVRNAQPVLVNTSRLIYQVSSLADCNVTAVYDRGVALVDGGAYTDLTQLQSAAPAAGQYRHYQGYFRLGASPAGTVTVDAEQATPTLGTVAAALAAERGYTLHADDVTALDAFGPVSVYLSSETDTLTLLDELAESIGGYLTSPSEGELRMGEWRAPEPNDNAIYPYSMSNITRSSTGAGENGLPVWRVTVEYDPNDTVQEDLAGSVPDERRARVAQPYRRVRATAQAVRDRHPLAGEITIQSRLTSRVIAQQVADRVLALLSVRRDTVEIEARETLTPTVGGNVTPTTPRLGYGDGRPMRVTGYRLNAENQELTLQLWG
ncbi:hypothetical protein AWR38_17750 [Idiomarina sp. WRN-38]|nr:hypothetical protein AUR68_17730 [Idiomarina sp. H105]OAE97136.1 hypothetical protein AWR38_17750 [Idiomarina sp. WRN-38]